MGIAGIGMWQLVIILAIVLLLFGTKRLGNIGKDLGSAIKGFRNSINEEEKEHVAAETSNDKLMNDLSLQSARRES